MKPADDKDFSSTKSILNGIEKKLPKKFTLSPDEKEYCFTLRLTGWELDVLYHVIDEFRKGNP